MANRGTSWLNCSHNPGLQICISLTITILNHRSKVLWVVYGPTGFSSRRTAYTCPNANQPVLLLHNRKLTSTLLHLSMILTYGINFMHYIYSLWNLSMIPDTRTISALCEYCTNIHQLLQCTKHSSGNQSYYVGSWPTHSSYSPHSSSRHRNKCKVTTLENEEIQR